MEGKVKEVPLSTTEADFREWFEEHLDQFDIREIILSQEPCPDYVVMMNDGTPAKVEA